MNVKPVALLTIVADNRMIGNVDDSPLPFDLPTPAAWMFHVGSGAAAGSKDSLKHSFIFGRRVYEEFMGYGVLPVGGGVNVVISGSLSNSYGTPKPLPTVKGDESTINSRLVAVGSVEEALEVGTKLEEKDPLPGEMCIVLGGQSIYTETLPKATVLRKCHMRAEFEGGILFPEHEEDDWKPVLKTKPKVEKNNVDGKDVEFQVIEYVRAKDASDVAMAPLIDSLKGVYAAFDALETEDSAE